MRERGGGRETETRCDERERGERVERGRERKRERGEGERGGKGERQRERKRERGGGRETEMRATL